VLQMRFRNRSGIVFSSLLVIAAGCGPQLPSDVTANLSEAKQMRLDFESLSGGGADAEGETVAAAEPTGWAALQGTFKVTGAMPKPALLKVDKEMDVCAPGGKQVYSPDIQIGANGELKDVVIYLSTAIPLEDPKWVHESYAESANAEVLFDQKECLFLSPMFAARSSQRIKIANSDPIGHNTNIAAKDSAAQFNQNISPNSFVNYAPGGTKGTGFSKAPFNVSCSVHPWMNASMLVRPDPYFAVTDASGAFKIANVPTGVPLEFRVWHASTKYLQKVTLNGEATTWSKGTMKVKLEPGADQTLEVAVDGGLFGK
jgi:hypothetical protein